MPGKNGDNVLEQTTQESGLSSQPSRGPRWLRFLNRVFGGGMDGESVKGGEHEDELNNILPMARAVAISKSLLSLLIGIAFFVAGFLYFERLLVILFSPRYLHDITDMFARGEAILPEGALSGEYTYPLKDTLPGLMVISIIVLGLSVLVLSPGLLFLIGYRLVTREVLDKELDEVGTLIQRIRTGLGRVKPIEEMLYSIFGRSNSAWELRLWSARITFWLGVIILCLAIWSVLTQNNLVFFGEGALAGVGSIALSKWLNPAEDIQKALSQNANIEISVIGFVQQMAIVEAWTSKAMLSMKPGDSWKPEQKIYQSLNRNAALIRKALEDSSKKIEKAGNFASQPNNKPKKKNK